MCSAGIDNTALRVCTCRAARDVFGLALGSTARFQKRMTEGKGLSSTMHEPCLKTVFGKVRCER